MHVRLLFSYFSAVLSFIGVYFITGDREKEFNQADPEEKQELLTGLFIRSYIVW